MSGQHKPNISRPSSDRTGTSRNQNLETETRHSWLRGRRASSDAHSSRRKSSERRRSLVRTAEDRRKWWKFTLRPWDDDQEQNWWFAGTAIPLLAATIGPLANVLSIAALVTPWRMCLINGVDPASCPWDGVTNLLYDLDGHTYNDPHWCYALNIVSLVTGFAGNIFLLFNFTNRIRYIIALPLTIILWYAATGILIGIEVSMNQYVPPQRPQQIYTQGFWYAVIAAILYLICSMLLMINMLGYFLGHYPQRFSLTDSQRTLILQTMLFFVWLAGGAGVFSLVESRYGEGLFNWSYVNALYFCQVTVLTIGFGDLYASSNVGRGIVMPYAVGGIVMLGLVISSITTFASELGQDNVLQKHIDKSRTRTLERSLTSAVELKEREQLVLGIRPTISRSFDPVNRSIAFAEDRVPTESDMSSRGPLMDALKRTASIPLTALRPARKPRLLLLREEKDRFKAMRRIQDATLKWKKWSGLCISISAFAILWCIGALMFWIAERRVQGITYFQSLYLCWVSLLTVGYGDLAPKSNAGRPFFVVWSLIAVPTMTLLVGDMGNTIVKSWEQGTFRLADFTILPKAGIWRTLVPRKLTPWLQERKERKAIRRRLQHGFETGVDEPTIPTIDNLARAAPSDTELAKRLAHAIQRTAKDLTAHPPRKYTFEEWVQFTQLIRFTAAASEREESGNRYEADQDGLIEWDWIGEHSPLMAQQSEAGFVLDRLCESMSRYVRRMDNLYGDTVRGQRDKDRDEEDRRQSAEIAELDDEIAEA